MMQVVTDAYPKLIFTTFYNMTYNIIDQSQSLYISFTTAWFMANYTVWDFPMYDYSVIPKRYKNRRLCDAFIYFFPFVFYRNK